MQRPCVFFDRDGIVNVSPGPGYVESWAAFQFMPAFPDVLAAVTRLGYVAVVITNQRGVALGRMTREDVETIHTNMRSVLRTTYGLELLDVYYCPHPRDSCTCRKPQPGMLLKAAAQHRLDLTASWMVGDHERDIEAGRNAGCRTILVGEAMETAADVQVESMDALRDRMVDILTRS